MKILFLTHTTFNKGNYFRCKKFGHELTKRGWDVTIMCVADTLRLLPKSYVYEGIKRIELPYFYRRMLRLLILPRLFIRGTGNPGWDVLDILFRKNHVRNTLYDVIYACEYFPSTMYPLDSIKNRSTTLVIGDRLDQFVDGGLYDLYPIPRSKYRRLHKYEREQLQQVDGLVCISEHLRARAIQMGGDPDSIAVIPGGAPVERVRPMSGSVSRRRLNIPGEVKVLLFLGAGHTDTVMLSRIITCLDPELRKQAWVVFVGHPNRNVRSMANRLPVNRVVFTGFVEDDELSDHLAVADVALLPLSDNVFNRSRWPSKIGEYLSAGCPTVVSNVGDVGAFVRTHQASLTADTEEEFARRIEDVLADESLASRLRTKARQSAEQYLSWNSLTNRLISHMVKIAGKTRKQAFVDALARHDEVKTEVP